MKISCTSISNCGSSNSLVLVLSETKLSETLVSTLGEPVADQITRAISAVGFTAEKKAILSIPAPAGTSHKRIILVGARGAETPREFREIGATIAAAPDACAAEDIALWTERHALEILRGLAMRAYSFDVYKAPQPLVKSVSYCGTEDLSDTTLNGLKVDVDAIHFARDLVNEPANELPPLKMAARVISACEEAGIKTQLLDQKALQKEGMGLLLGVGQGSDNPPCAVVMTIGKGKSAPAALIGKGICFDTGGVNVKSVMGMWEMKGDMAGAAVVTSAMLSLAKNGFKGDIVAVIGLAENMTGGSAIRPGDILRSYNGQTVEVRNTDCEGRLVLADCLSYAQRQLGARKVIDIATLTYAVQIGLGTRYAGIYGNAETLLSSVKQAADSACELVWPMPIDEAFHAQLKSDFADMLNWPGVTYGNASIAAAFLENFIDDGVEWAHIDVGGPAYAGAESAFAPPGGTGFGTETLANLARLIA